MKLPIKRHSWWYFRSLWAKVDSFCKVSLDSVLSLEVQHASVPDLQNNSNEYCTKCTVQYGSVEISRYGIVHCYLPRNVIYVWLRETATAYIFQFQIPYVVAVSSGSTEKFMTRCTLFLSLAGPLPTESFPCVLFFCAHIYHYFSFPLNSAEVYVTGCTHCQDAAQSFKGTTNPLNFNCRALLEDTETCISWGPCSG